MRRREGGDGYDCMMCLWMIVFWIGYSTMPALTQCVSSARADRLAVTEWVPLHIEMQIAASHYQPVLTIPDRGVFLDISDDNEWNGGSP